LLHSTDDQDLIWMTTCTPEIAQVRGYCFAQVRVATTRCMPQQMGTLLCKDLRSEPFPNIDREFVDRREPGNQGHARSGVKRAEIKLVPYALIWDCAYAMGDASSMLDRPIRFWSIAWNSLCGELVSGQKSLRKRMRNKRSRSGFRAEITFGVELRECEVDRHSRDFEGIGHGSRGGKPGRCVGEDARFQLIPNLAIELLVQRFGCASVEPNQFESDD
jgi:hypothetical protein